MQASLSSPLKRISVLDALRGFALLGIILMHMIQHFGFGSVPASTPILQFPALDELSRWLGYNVIMGRFINVFAFLFGISLFIQIDRAAHKGIDFRKRFIWKMLILMALGLLAHAFYSMEILSVYAFFGLILLAVYRVKSWILILLSAALLFGVPRIIQTNYHNSQLAEQPVSVAQTQLQNAERTQPPALPEHIANPSLINTAIHNYQDRFAGKLNYQFGFIGRGYVTLALFLIGLVVARTRVLQQLQAHKKNNWYLFVGFTVATISITLLQNILPEHNTRVFFRAEGIYLSSGLLIAQTLNDISLVLFTGALVTGFILVYQSKVGHYLETLAPYGRAALTNYLMQGVIGALLFAPWALGSYFGSWGIFALCMLGIAIYLIQGACSKLWLTHYLYGPLEWLWRSATYLKRQPFVR
ncbi:DUF418 domain-containing protein [Catenovulum sp. 2E275]|uniref:DUF418 domain-containing protein n=1 Tax=Catenovulum sp. 2E275 TaxID=2980497 RepID=UPI0021D1D378|nr:DUF418 domain-containing protein [Catenovulum sp. 2E275]MCU4677316.1 DUF418 domain-containing protein [Catenovulum sp. 2E275]